MSHPIPGPPRTMAVEVETESEPDVQPDTQADIESAVQRDSQPDIEASSASQPRTDHSGEDAKEPESTGAQGREGERAASEPSRTPVPTPDTGDPMIDATLEELASADPDDLDAMVAAGESTHRVLQARLSDLGE